MLFPDSGFYILHSLKEKERNKEICKKKKMLQLCVAEESTGAAGHWYDGH